MWGRVALIALLLAISIAAGAAVLVALVFFFDFRKLPDYVIPNVPPLSIFNDEVFNAGIGASVTSKIMLLRYWGEEASTLDETLMDKLQRFTDLNDVAGFFADRGYNFEVVTLRTPEELSTYINEERATPLLFRQAISQEPPVRADRVLIGLKNGGKTVVLHDFYYGHNYELSWKEFRELWDADPAKGFRHVYLAVWPRSEARVQTLKERVTTPYPPRLPLMDDLKSLWPAVVSVERLAGQTGETNAELDKALASLLEHPRYDLLHPLLKIWSYLQVVRAKRVAGDYPATRALLEKADILNQNLDQQYGQWPRYHNNETSSVYRAWTFYYQDVKDVQGASVASARAQTLWEERNAWLRDFYARQGQ